MADAKKCDRCGGFFEQPVTPDLKLSRYVHGYGTFSIDLCPVCRTGLEMFLDNQPVVPSMEYLQKVRENDETASAVR